MPAIEQIMQTSPVIPVIVINSPEEALPLATALYNGGLKVLEVTLRTEHALQAISTIRQALPDAIVGSGTVLTPDDVAASKAAGAQFLVSPGSPDKLVDAMQASELPALPGVASVTEAMRLAERGIRHMKLFPAEAVGGAKLLASMHSPLPQLRFCPTGGISPAIAGDYLALPNVLCVGGSWMLDKALVAAGDWAAIQAQAAEAAAL